MNSCTVRRGIQDPAFGLLRGDEQSDRGRCDVRCKGLFTYHANISAGWEYVRHWTPPIRCQERPESCESLKRSVAEDGKIIGKER